MSKGPTSYGQHAGSKFRPRKVALLWVKEGSRIRLARDNGGSYLSVIFVHETRSDRAIPPYSTCRTNGASDSTTVHQTLTNTVWWKSPRTGTVSFSKLGGWDTSVSKRGSGYFEMRAVSLIHLLIRGGWCFTVSDLRFRLMLLCLRPVGGRP